MLSTLKENKTCFTHQQVERARQARHLARALGCPSNADLKTLIRLNLIKDCPVVQDDIVLAEKIFGKDIAILKGKTTRKKPILVVHDTIVIPKALTEAQKDVTICIDTFFVNNMPFLHTISERIYYRTSQWIPDCETST
jgi:DNA-binding GntR family transcriptional regulator